MARIEGVKAPREHNESVAPVSKLDPRDDDRQLRSALGLIGNPLVGETNWIYPGQSFLSDSTPPKLEAMDAPSDVDPFILGQLRSDGLKHRSGFPREAANMNVKLVLSPREPRVYSESDVVMRQRFLNRIGQKRAGVPSVFEIVWNRENPKRRILDAEDFLRRRQKVRACLPGDAG